LKIHDEDAQDRQLVTRFARERDESAFRALYRKHTPLLYRLALRMTGDEGKAADIVQDTWVRAVQALPSFRWESRLSTWLSGIAINRSREELRRRDPADSPDAATEPAGNAGMRPGQRVDLERAIARLPIGYREVLLLHDVEGLTHEEIAQALAIEASTSRSQLTRARAAMRSWLEQKKEGES
jgi:RNA polymerase sigma-70 factor (ECF subfamily)